MYLIKNLLFFYQQHSYFKKREGVAKNYYQAKRKKQLGSMDNKEYYNKLKALKEYLTIIELRYAHVSPYK